MIEELFEQIELSISDVKKKFYGVTSGRVINLLDDPITVEHEVTYLDLGKLLRRDARCAGHPDRIVARGAR